MFLRSALLACLPVLALVCTSTLQAGHFEETNKEFGSVPRGTTLVHQFRLTNSLNQALHVASMRTSCGCATATVGREEIQPGQSTVLQVTVDTRKYGGYRQFTIHVLFDRPALEEVRLTVAATSREDITLTPGQLEFGRVKRGSPAKTTATIQYHGLGPWQITGVENDNGYLKPELLQLSTGVGQTAYQLQVSLRPDIPPGAWHADIFLKTTDPATPRIRVPLVVEVESALTATPNELQFGQVKAGGMAERKVVIRGTAPFKITKIEGESSQIKVEGHGDEAKAVHVLKVTIQPGATASELLKKLKVHTNLSEGESIEFGVMAVVTP